MPMPPAAPHRATPSPWPPEPPCRGDPLRVRSRSHSTCPSTTRQCGRWRHHRSSPCRRRDRRCRYLRGSPRSWQTHSLANPAASTGASWATLYASRALRIARHTQAPQTNLPSAAVLSQVSERAAGHWTRNTTRPGEERRRARRDHRLESPSVSGAMALVSPDSRFRSIRLAPETGRERPTRTLQRERSPPVLDSELCVGVARGASGRDAAALSTGDGFGRAGRLVAAQGSACWVSFDTSLCCGPVLDRSRKMRAGGGMGLLATSMPGGAGSGGQRLTSLGSLGRSPPAPGRCASFGRQRQRCASLASGALAAAPRAVGLNDDQNTGYGSGLTSATTTTSAGLAVSAPPPPSLGTDAECLGRAASRSARGCVRPILGFPALGVGMSVSRGLRHSSQTSLDGTPGDNNTGNSVVGYGRVLSGRYALWQRSRLSAEDSPALGPRRTDPTALSAATRMDPSLGAVGSDLVMGVAGVLTTTGCQNPDLSPLALMVLPSRDLDEIGMVRSHCALPSPRRFSTT
eukprot:ctg_700.g323